MAREVRQALKRVICERTPNIDSLNGNQIDRSRQHGDCIEDGIFGQNLPCGSSSVCTRAMDYFQYS